MVKSKSELLERLSQDFPAEHVNYIVEIAEKLGKGMVIDFKPGGAGSPLEVEIHDPTPGDDNWRKRELDRLVTDASGNQSAKEKDWFRLQIAELTGARATIWINEDEDKYNDTSVLLGELVSKLYELCGRVV